MSDAEPGIVVLGMPRSGTTLVRRILASHPRISCPPETNLLSAASRFLDEHEFASGMTVGVIPGLGFSGIDESTFVSEMRSFVCGFFEDIAARAGKPRWAEKTAVDIFHLDQIERLLGDSCQYVCVFRHPLDVVCSIVELSDKMAMYLPELHTYVSRYLSPHEAFAHAWAEANTRLLRFMQDHAGNCTSLMYEQLTEDPRSVVSRLFDFLQENVDADAILKSATGTGHDIGLGDWKTYGFEQISGASVGRRRQLDPVMTNRLAYIVNPVMAKCGYDTIPVRHAPRGAAARRHFELSMRVGLMSKDTTGEGGA